MNLKIQLNSFERAVGMFIVGSIIIFVMVLATVAIKQAWFQKTNQYYSVYDEGDDLHVGTSVLVGGIKAGRVSSIDIQEDNKIRVTFEVKNRYASRIRQDSVATVMRSFVIGEKHINISLGNSDQVVAEGGQIHGEASSELSDLLSGRKVKPYLKTLESLFGYMTALVEQLNQSSEKFDLVGIYREVMPTLKTAQSAFKSVPSMKDDLNKLGTLMDSNDTKSFISHANRLSQDLGQLAKALNQVSPELQQSVRDIAQFTPHMAKASPELVTLMTRMRQTLDEMVVVLKASQKSWFLNSHVKDIKKEEDTRSPASP